MKLNINRLALSAALAAAAIVIATATANAQIISANFNESLDLPDLGSVGPRVLARTGVTLPSAGPQLTGANQISNPTGWGSCLNVSFDATTNILSVTGDSFNSYQTITVTLDSLLFAVAGQQITGITPISVGNAVTERDGNPFSRQQFFSPNSFSINYSTPLGLGTRFFITSAGTDTYQVTLGNAVAVVPEAGTVALLLPALGVLCAVVVRRRRK